MIECYDDYTYAYVTWLFSMVLFSPIALLVVIGMIVKIIEIIKKIRGKMK